jgi:ribosomal protein L15
MLRMKNLPVKVLGKWTLEGKITVKAAKASASAIKAIEAAGGSIELSEWTAETEPKAEEKTEELVK